MKAVKVTGDILQQKWRWTHLSGVTAQLEERRVVVGIALLDSHPGVPFVSRACEVRIKRRSQATDEIRKWVLEVPVLALAEAVPCHVDVASEVDLVRIESGKGATFLGREKSFGKTAQP